MNAALLSEALAALKRGWALTPLHGKKPFLTGWQELPRATEEQVRAWIAQGHNLGVRCGPVSGVDCIDIDKDAPPEFRSRLPRTPTQLTGSGAYHALFRATAGLKNHVGKLAPHVDIRTKGGQFVLAGSIHPETKQPYTWDVHPDECPFAEFPAHLLPKPKPPRATQQPKATGASAWARKALEDEVHAVSQAPEGTRNDRLNIAAFNLGQITELAEAEIADRLLGAAMSAGLPESESRKTIASGYAAGAKSPRQKPALPAPIVAVKQRPPALNGILTPGSHVLPTGEYREVQGTEFAREVLCKLPEGTIYRRGGAIGEVFGHPTEFRVLTPHRVRILTGKHVRLCASKAGKEGEPPTETFQPVSRDHADLILASSVDHGDVRDLDHIVSHPVFSADWTLSKPGHSKRTYYDEPAALEHLEPIRDRHEIQAVFDDLLVDFPFEAEADRQTYIGLLLTPLVRPAIQGNCPLHLITSPQERTGKTKLASDVLGGIYLGAPVPVMQLSGSEDEREKRILAMLLAGTRLIHLDNLAGELDSAVLASTLTASHVHGRILGRTENVTVPNGCVVVATGNNARTSSEIAKRTVPSRLLARTEAPETRTDFRHVDIAAYVVTQRRAVLGAMVGMVLNWIEAGRPSATRPMGGFDAWAATVGGILEVAGYSDWLASAVEWRAGADDFSADLRAFVEAWAVRYGLETPSELLALADEHGLFGPMLMRVHGDRARVTAFSLRVLKRAEGRVVGTWRVDAISVGTHRRFQLVPLEVL